MKTYSALELSEVIENHHKWLDGEDDGSRADLSSADLRYANLSSADLRYANLSSADLRYANLSSSDLSSADLSSSDLSYANLRSANLLDSSIWGATGDMKHLKSIFLEEYQITYTSEVMQIGCQKHKISEWWGFDDERILKMDGKRALKFWRKYEGLIKQAIELSPAIPTGADNEKS